MQHQHQGLYTSKDKTWFFTVFKRLRSFLLQFLHTGKLKIKPFSSQSGAIKSVENINGKACQKCNHSNTTDASRNGVLVCFISHFLNWNLSREKITQRTIMILQLLNSAKLHSDWSSRTSEAATVQLQKQPWWLKRWHLAVTSSPHDCFLISKMGIKNSNLKRFF